MRGGDNLLFLIIAVLLIGYIIIKVLGVILIVVLCIGVAAFFSYYTYKGLSFIKLNSVQNAPNANKKKPSLNSDTIFCFSDQIEDIVSVYGIDIVKETRLVNVLKDLFPDRDNAEKFVIINSIIQSGTTTDLLNNCSINNIEYFVKVHTKRLGNQRINSNSDITELLYGFAIGCGVITKEEFEARVLGYSVGQYKENKRINNVDICLIIIGCLGLVLTPPVLFNYRASSLWQFLQVVISFSTIAPLLFYVLKKDKLNSVCGGVLLGLCVLHILLFLFGLNCFASNELSNYANFKTGLNEYELRDFMDSTEYYISYSVFSVIPSIILGAIVFLIGEYYLKERYGFDFWFGLLATLLLSIVPVIMYNTIPRQEITRMNERVKLANIETEKLINSHGNEYKELSFLDFKLGDDLLSYSHTEFEIINKSYYNEIPSFIDSIVNVSSKWDNLNADIYLMTSGNRILEIEVNTEQTTDSVIKMFTLKYGEPEKPIIPLYANDYFETKPMYIGNLVSHKSPRASYSFKNCQIIITDYSSKKYYKYEYNSEFKTTIIYRHNDYMQLQDALIRERERNDSIINKRMTDSINAVNKEEQERIEKLQKEHKENHIKAIKQI